MLGLILIPVLTPATPIRKTARMRRMRRRRGQTVPDRHCIACHAGCGGQPCSLAGTENIHSAAGLCDLPAACQRTLAPREEGPALRCDALRRRLVRKRSVCFRRVMPGRAPRCHHPSHPHPPPPTEACLLNLDMVDREIPTVRIVFHPLRHLHFRIA